MPFPLHKSPFGLLELFRLRTLGANPPQFGEVVTPVADVTEYYAALNKLQSASVATVGAITGVGISDDLILTAPIRLHYISALFICGAAAATNVTLGVRLTDGTATGGGTSNFYAAVNAAARVTVAFALPVPTIIPAGWIIRAYVSGTAAGVDHQIIPVCMIDSVGPNGP